MIPAGPYSGYSIAQLTQLTQPDANDLVPIFHMATGNTEAVPASSFGGGAVLPIAFNTSFSPVTVYNYGAFVQSPGLGNAANTTALVNMAAAMGSPPPTGRTGGYGWFPNYEFGVNAGPLPIVWWDGTILQSLGSASFGSSLFDITSIDSAGDTFFACLASNAHSQGGIYFRNLTFHWITQGNVADLAINASSWGVKIQDCSFTDCPTAVAFGGNLTDTNGLGCSMERCNIFYGKSGSVLNNACMVIMAGEQAQILGPAEFQQQARGHGGPTGVVGIGWGGGLAGSEHQIIQGIHISAFTWGMDFSNFAATNGRGPLTALVGGVQRFTVRDCEINSYSQAITLACQTSGPNTSSIVAGTFDGNNLSKVQDSQSDANAIVLIDSLNNSGGSNSNIVDLTFVGNTIFSNVTLDSKHSGIAANNQYGVEIRGGSALVFLGGKIGNVGNNASNGGGVWADGCAAVYIWDGGGGGGPGATTFSGVQLTPAIAGGYYGGGATGAGSQQYGILLGGTLNNGPIVFDNCYLGGYTGTGQAAVKVTGTIASGTLYITNCPGYNDQNTIVNGFAGILAGTAYAAYNQSLNVTHAGTSYYGPSLVVAVANAAGGTLQINGGTAQTLLNSQAVSFWLNSPYDTFQFNTHAPASLYWVGK